MAKKIKSVISYTYDFQQFGVLRSQDFKKYLDSKEFFDEQGNVIEQIKYTPDAKEEERTINHYDEKNRLTKQVREFIQNGTTESVEVNHNDALGITEEIRFYNGEAGEKVLVKRNEQGDVIEQVEYDEDGEQLSRETYSYLEQGLVSEECRYNESDVLVKKVLNTYNKEKKMVKQRLTFPEGDDQPYTLTIEYPEPLKQKGMATYDNGEIKFETLDVFDTKGREVEAHFLDPESSDESWQLKRAYNEQGKPLFREQYNGDDVLIFRNDYEYENGLLIAILFYRFNPYNAMATKHRTQYEYVFFDSVA